MKVLLSTLLLGSLAMSASACAVAKGNGLVDVAVIDRDTGSVLSTYAHDGQRFIAGVPGHRYAVRITNLSSQRILTVLSVDGVNAITGQTADPNQSGYVLDAYQSTEVDGWRKNMSEIAQFNFTALSDSYAARTGRPNNVGVIGVAAFREKQHPVWRERDEKIAAQPTPPPATAAPAPAYPTAADTAAPAGRLAEKAQAPASESARAYNGYAEARPMPKQEESLGTGHGARESSYASYTTFERESSQPNVVVSLWYDSYNNLVARGVLPPPPPPRSVPREPQAFPNSFVPDPAG